MTPRSPTRTGPPDFVGVGTQRSGTTWWFRVMAAHPAIRTPHRGRKELHFFDEFALRPMTDEDVRRYHEWFPRRDGQVVGEWTPRYMRDFWTPPLLRRAAPETRLLVMLRDPVERFRSGVMHQLSRGFERRADMLAVDAVERGRYALQLRRLRECFDPERILVIQYEKCLTDAPGEYRRTVRFLGVDEHEGRPEFAQARGTTTAAQKRELWPELVSSLQVALADDVRELMTLVPHLDVECWPHFRHLA
jgi:hypothetical protein